VRDLRNRVQRAMLVAPGGEIGVADLALPAAPEKPARSVEAGPAQLAERARIERILLEASGNISRAAALLGLSRQALYRKMERLGIEMERRPRD
jgi:transcriptional regulator of acetoin/glycerol metabolism